MQREPEPSKSYSFFSVLLDLPKIAMLAKLQEFIQKNEEESDQFGKVFKSIFIQLNEDFYVSLGPLFFELAPIFLESIRVNITFFCSSFFIFLTLEDEGVEIDLDVTPKAQAAKKFSEVSANLETVNALLLDIDKLALFN